MNNIKCFQCGFTNWANAVVCKKCNVSLADGAGIEGNFRSAPPRAIQKPSGFQILKNDYVAFLGAILPVVGWAIYIAVTFFGLSPRSRYSKTVVENSGDNPMFLIIAIVFSLGGAALLFWRISSISRIFESGERVIGYITSVEFFKDRGRIEFSYSYKRQDFQNGAGIMKNSKTESYRNGDEVVLIIDAANPKRVLIEDLYV